MKKRKENMTPDYRKSGYLKVGRSVLRAFFMGERDLRELASVLLCVETFAYFSEGQVWLNDQVYFCHPGEWITSYGDRGTNGYRSPPGQEVSGEARKTTFRVCVECRFLQADCVGQL